MQPACSMVMRDLRGPLTITTVLVNVEQVLANSKLSTVVEGKKMRNSIGIISKMQADERMKGSVLPHEQRWALATTKVAELPLQA